MRKFGTSKDKSLSVAFIGNILILGDAESVVQILQAKKNGENFTKNAAFQQFANSKAVAATYSEDLDSGAKLVEIMGVRKQNIKEFTPIFMTETIFTKKGVERKTVSDFGILGMILEQTED